MSNESIYKLLSLLQNSFENENESLTVYAKTVNFLSTAMKNVAKLYEQLPITEKIRQSGVVH